jgi:hypothetical protein
MGKRWGRMASVRANYDVPACRGREVLWNGGKFPVAARIISSTGSDLYLRDANGRRIGPCHPCWKIDYLDGRGDRTGQPTPMDRAWASQPQQGRTT